MKYYYAILIALAAIVAFTSFAVAGKESQATINLKLFNEIFEFLKYIAWAAGIFLVILSAIGVAFFGFDVRKARASILDTVDEAKGLLDEIKERHLELNKQYSELEQKKDRFNEFIKEGEKQIGELGSRVEELVDKIEAKEEKTDKTPSKKDVTDSSDTLTTERSNEDLIREIIQKSTFNWTTISRLMKKTGLTRDEVLEIARKMPDIEIGIGSKSKDHIFRIKSN